MAINYSNTSGSACAIWSDSMPSYFMSNGRNFIEFPLTEEGMKDIKKFRKNHMEFKYCRISYGRYSDSTPFGTIGKHGINMPGEINYAELQ